MLDTDLLPIPSLRPDGRLERLNYGGGSNQKKVDRWVGDMGQFRKETGINPAAGPQSQKRFNNWLNEGGVSGGASVASSSAKPPQQQQAAPAQAAAASASPMYTDKKKRRTLLSGGALNQDQNGTILGAA
jgi:hypothetical protein